MKWCAALRCAVSRGSGAPWPWGRYASRHKGGVAGVERRAGLGSWGSCGFWKDSRPEMGGVGAVVVDLRVLLAVCRERLV